MRVKNRILKCRKTTLGFFEEKLGFWYCTAILLLGSPIIAFTIYLVLDRLVSANYNLGAMWASSEDARYILSALSQAQAAIFGIFFTLNFIIFQTQIGNVSPASIKRSLHSTKLMFIFTVFVVSISTDLILLRYIPSKDGLEINIFWPISLSIFAILILVPYMRINLMNLVKEAIVEEILSRRARYNLEGVDLSGIDLSSAFMINKRGEEYEGADLIKRNLKRSNLSRTNLKKASLDNTNLAETNLSGACLEGADFKDANLTDADLSGADLRDCQLLRADLNGTKLNKIVHSEKTLESLLLKSNNLTMAHRDKELNDDLIRYANDRLKRDNLDETDKDKLEKFLSSQSNCEDAYPPDQELISK